MDESDLVESYRLNTEYDGNQVRYREYPAGRLIEDWTVGKVLGRGGHSVVRKHREEGIGRVRVVKSIEKSGCPFHAREFNIMAILNKVRAILEYRSLFVEFLGWFEDSDRLYIAMEYFEQGDLRKHLNEPLPEEAVQRITKQVLKGLQVMHEIGIAHRDLKPDNIFVVSMSPVWVKLGDFGISKRIHSDTAYRSRVCTDYYAAPEVLGIDSTSESSIYTNAVDIWSLGCVVYELLEGARLFSSLGDIIAYYYNKGDFLAGRLSRLTAPIGETVKWFIQALVLRDPEGRPSAVKAAGHVWLRGHALVGSEVGDCASLNPSDTWSDFKEHGALGEWGTNDTTSDTGAAIGASPTTSLFSSFVPNDQNTAADSRTHTPSTQTLSLEYACPSPSRDQFLAEADKNKHPALLRIRCYIWVSQFLPSQEPHK
ncbi:kinase-like domain-containing protein [Tuber brumale]|nr:kinase-like domain-containing protein [Tuber brumale]